MNRDLTNLARAVDRFFAVLGATVWQPFERAVTALDDGFHKHLALSVVTTVTAVVVVCTVCIVAVVQP